VEHGRASDERRSRREQIVWQLNRDGWARGDFDVVLELLDPAVIWTAIEDAPDAGTYRGHESVRAYMQDWLDDFDLEAQPIEDSVEIGDRLLCMQRAVATGKASGIRSELEYVCVYTFGPDERIMDVHEYATRDGAFAAAGY
jgi:ketosteroid isomerase-like protein